MASFSGLWDNEYGENYAPLSETVHIGNGLTGLARLFAGRIYGRSVLRELIDTLVAGSVGDPAAASHKRVRAERDLEANVQGGDRVIENFASIARNTTLADQSAILRGLNLSSAPSYPRDRSGNGGGSKLGW